MVNRLSLALLAVLSGVGLTQAHELALTFSGSEYQGGPAFEVRLGDKVIGTGIVDPLPPSGQGYEFTFQLPDALTADSGPLSIHMTNDAHQGPNEDRNLYLLAARIDDTQVPLTAFHYTKQGKPFDRKLRQGRLELWSNYEVASLPMPPGASPSDFPTASVSDTPSTTSVAPPAKAASTQVAEAAPASSICTASAAIVGIQTVSKPLSKSQLATLETVMEQAKAGSCGIVLKGYATQGGSAESNNKASLLRAKLVLDTLKNAGLTFASEKVVGAGATNQFGSDDASNQRVSVALTEAGKK